LAPWVTRCGFVRRQRDAELPVPSGPLVSWSRSRVPRDRGGIYMGDPARAGRSLGSLATSGWEAPAGSPTAPREQRGRRAPLEGAGGRTTSRLKKLHIGKTLPKGRETPFHEAGAFAAGMPRGARGNLQNQAVTGESRRRLRVALGLQSDDTDRLRWAEVSAGCLGMPRPRLT